MFDIAVTGRHPLGRKGGIHVIKIRSAANPRMGFSIRGGSDFGLGIYVSHVESSSHAGESSCSLCVMYKNKSLLGEVLSFMNHIDPCQLQKNIHVSWNCSLKKKKKKEKNYISSLSLSLSLPSPGMPNKLTLSLPHTQCVYVSVVAYARAHLCVCVCMCVCVYVCVS